MVSRLVLLRSSSYQPQHMMRLVCLLSFSCQSHQRLVCLPHVQTHASRTLKTKFFNQLWYFRCKTTKTSRVYPGSRRPSRAGVGRTGGGPRRGPEGGRAAAGRGAGVGGRHRVVEEPRPGTHHRRALPRPSAPHRTGPLSWKGLGIDFEKVCQAFLSYLPTPS